MKEIPSRISPLDLAAQLPPGWTIEAHGPTILWDCEGYNRDAAHRSSRQVTKEGLPLLQFENYIRTYLRVHCDKGIRIPDSFYVHTPIRVYLLMYVPCHPSILFKNGFNGSFDNPLWLVFGTPVEGSEASKFFRDGCFIDLSTFENAIKMMRMSDRLWESKPQKVLWSPTRKIPIREVPA